MPRRSHVRPAALFPTHTAPADSVVATIDGAARGNPGPAAYGVVFEDAKGKVLARLSARLGRATNNVAEYRALLAALVYAGERHWRALRVRTDSELLARQLEGDYKVKSADLKPLHREAQQLIVALDSFSVEAVPRKLTSMADRLANAALDGRPLSRRANLSRAKPRDAALDKRAAISVRRPATKKPKFKPAASAAGTTGRSPWPERNRIRALYEGGVLKLLDKLDLADGEEVELIVRRRQ